jgi:hypothetical protein
LRETVLVVEDDESVAELIRQHLTDRTDRARSEVPDGAVVK